MFALGYDLWEELIPCSLLSLSLTCAGQRQQLQYGAVQPPSGGSKQWATPSKGTTPKSTVPRGRCQFHAISAGIPPSTRGPPGTVGATRASPSRWKFLWWSILSWTWWPPAQKGAWLWDERKRAWLCLLERKRWIFSVTLGVTKNVWEDIIILPI